MKFVFLLSGLFFVHFASGQVINLPYSTMDKEINGDLEDWQGQWIKIDNPISDRYKNDNAVMVEWDFDHLYVAFKIGDRWFCANEHGENNPRLYFNDGVEIYIDSGHDSKDRMDKNDYQFLLSITGERVVFKGDKHMMSEGHLVPKDYDNNNILIRSAVQYDGTINTMDDTDRQYQVEASIPWAAIGIEAKTNKRIKMDLCINDIDTFTNIVAMPDTLHPLSMNYITLKGKRDYGFPSDWSEFILTGGPSSMQKLRAKLNPYFAPISVLMTCLLSLLIYVIAKQYRKIQFLKNFPKKEDTDKFLLVSNEINTETDSPSSPVAQHEIIEKSKTFIKDHIKETITLDQLCKAVNLGERQVQRIFKSAIGLTPVQYINILKLEEAASLLSTTTLTVAEIAFTLSFSDASYFSSVFKKYFGKTPKEYRKEI